jgi:hypothetical protein
VHESRIFAVFDELMFHDAIGDRSRGPQGDLDEILSDSDAKAERLVERVSEAKVFVPVRHGRVRAERGETGRISIDIDRVSVALLDLQART